MLSVCPEPIGSQNPRAIIFTRGNVRMKSGRRRFHIRYRLSVGTKIESLAMIASFSGLPKLRVDWGDHASSRTRCGKSQRDIIHQPGVDGPSRTSEEWLRRVINPMILPQRGFISFGGRRCNPFRVEKIAGRLPKVALPRNLGRNDSIPLGFQRVGGGGRV